MGRWLYLELVGNAVQPMAVREQAPSEFLAADDTIAQEPTNVGRAACQSSLMCLGRVWGRSAPLADRSVGGALRWRSAPLAERSAGEGARCAGETVTVAILAQGTNRAVAISQAFFQSTW